MLTPNSIKTFKMVHIKKFLLKKKEHGGPCETRVHRHTHTIDKVSWWGPFGHLDLINLDIGITSDHTVGIHIIKNHVPLLLKVLHGSPPDLEHGMLCHSLPRSFPPLQSDETPSSVTRISLQSPNKPWSFPHPSVPLARPFFCVSACRKRLLSFKIPLWYYPSCKIPP